MNVMLDIETLDTRSTSVILSIGACQFDENGVIHNTLHKRIDIDSCLRRGLTVGGHTILWWMDQSEEARRNLTQGEICSLEQALSALSSFIKQGDVVWANGANFDVPILENAYEKCNMATPWVYYNVRDYRTVSKLVPKDEFNRIRSQPTLKHNALEDAMAQARTLVNVIEWIENQNAIKLAA